MPTTPYPFVSGEVLLASDLNAIQNLPLNDQTDSYTLEVADAYKRIVMNKATATTLTVNNSIFTAGDVIQVMNKGAGTMTVTAGAGVTINTASSLAVAQYGGGTLVALSASVFNFFSPSGSSYGIASGGSSSSISVGGVSYTLLTFTSDANLVVSKAGLFDVLMFGGGGAGGFSQSNVGAGGGGAGGYVQQTVYLDATTFAVDIGAGGSATTTTGTAGFITSLGTTARSMAVLFGGPGYNNAGGAGTSVAERSGGCGGGGGNVITAGGNSFMPTITGFGGGTGPAGANNGGGGGGGVTAVGGNGVTSTGGAGGAGYDVSTFIGAGSPLYKGGGGGGGGTVGGAGGSSVGGAGGSNAAGTAAGANTGSGGGGAGLTSTFSGGAGGSGICYVRFRT